MKVKTNGAYYRAPNNHMLNLDLSNARESKLKIISSLIHISF